MYTSPSEKNKNTVYTHINVDLDAVASVWAAKKFIPGMKHSSVAFRSADWDGSGMNEHDCAVDIPAGGKGIKGTIADDTSVYSCFSLILERYASPEDCEILNPLITFLDTQDRFGNAERRLLGPDVDANTKQLFSLTGLNGILRATQFFYRGNDGMTVQRMGEIFEGMFGLLKKRKKSLLELDTVAQIFPGGKVALVRDALLPGIINFALFEKGVKVIVYVNKYNVGLFRDSSETIRMDHPDIKKIIEAAGELDEWFAHPSGFLFARGSRKAPVQTPSRVDPEKLAETIAQLIT